MLCRVLGRYANGTPGEAADKAAAAAGSAAARAAAADEAFEAEEAAETSAKARKRQLAKEAREVTRRPEPTLSLKTRQPLCGTGSAGLIRSGQTPTVTHRRLCDSGPATDIGFLMGKCLVPRYDSLARACTHMLANMGHSEKETKALSQAPQSRVAVSSFHGVDSAMCVPRENSEGGPLDVQDRPCATSTAPAIF